MEIGPERQDRHPRSLYEALPRNIITTTTDTVLGMARKSSLWPVTFGLACCAIEMIATAMAHHDLDRYGVLFFAATPRQADIMIISGTVTKKMAPAVKLLYEQMPLPKWVIAMGNCAVNGGPFARYDRVVQGVDEIIPVDVYLPGCPPRPEALQDAILKLQERVMRQHKELRLPQASLRAAV